MSVLTAYDVYTEAASALRYRAEKLRGLLAAVDDEAAAQELIDRWTDCARTLDDMAAGQIR